MTGAQEAVPGVFGAVHPIERNQFHAELVGEEFDLRLDIACADHEVMEPFNLVGHVNLPQ